MYGTLELALNKVNVKILNILPYRDWQAQYIETDSRYGTLLF